MRKSSPKLKAAKPKNIFLKPLKADFKDLFVALSKGVGHTVIGKWEELGTDAVEALSAIGIQTDPEELIYLLVRRSAIRALFDIVGEGVSQALADAKEDEKSLLEQIEFTISFRQSDFDSRFIDRPAGLALVEDLQNLLQTWLELHRIPKPTARAVAARFPSYFVYSLNQEWRRNAKSYSPIIDAINAPFARAGDREWAWAAYSSLLQRRINENIFDEPFALSQLYVPLNAYFLEDPKGREISAKITLSEEPERRVVVALEAELNQWIEDSKREDAIRVISGGPGSGKSSFARIFAAKISQEGKLKVLFVPLHLFDPSKDITEEVGRFVKDEGVLTQNPLDPDSPEPNLLVIFDGLDELASQGKAAVETARSFIREVERTVEKRNLQTVRLRVLISGRELVIQENQPEFRRARQVLNLLPYLVSKQTPDEASPNADKEKYLDSEKLLKQDLRHQWWRNYGTLTGKGFKSLPRELRRPELDEITAQPLLNYLVALSFTRQKLDFSKDINPNSIYADLVAAVHERGYEKKRPYVPIRRMSAEDFSRVLEEVGLAAWHGDGRTTTVKEIEDHCRASGVGRLLEAFQEGAKSGVTRLLAAFFFRQYGQRQSGDPTFVFTHKSFGEYLAARRIVRAVEKVARELNRRGDNPDEGWDERESLKHWAQVCGPGPVNESLHHFLLNEFKLIQPAQAASIQGKLTRIFNHILSFGMPMEQLQLSSFKQALFQSRNAEEALIAALNACATVTASWSAIESNDPTVFGRWFKRIQGQRIGPQPCLAAGCLSYLDLSGSLLDIGDFYGANLRQSKLVEAAANYAVFGRADLTKADFTESAIFKANFDGALMAFATLDKAHAQEAVFSAAILDESSLQAARLDRTTFERASLIRANLKGASLHGASFTLAKLDLANLQKANLQEAVLRGARLQGADLQGANLMAADLQGANLQGANLKGANLDKTKLQGTNLQGANLEGTQIESKQPRSSPPPSPNQQ
jgi:uncharacterized protein YjbI with pentapeptide repeats